MKRGCCTVALAFVGACGGATGERVVVGPAGPAVGETASQPDEAHQLLIAATGCWFGGTWRDALNESGSPAVDRCALVLARAYGRVDTVRLERLRGLETVEVSELADRLSDLQWADGGEPKGPMLSRLLVAVADAQRETMLARRAADRIKKDIAGDREPSKKPSDEKNSVKPLATTEALFQLLRTDAGPLRAESQSIGLLCALDRMETARGLPKHLKVYALEGVFEMLFGVKPPAVPEDATAPMRAGVWLTYLSEVALADKHPVPARARSLEDRELMAWGGVLEGFSDKLRDEVSDLSGRTELRRVATATVERLDTEYRASEAAILAARP